MTATPEQPDPSVPPVPPAPPTQPAPPPNQAPEHAAPQYPAPQYPAQQYAAPQYPAQQYPAPQYGYQPVAPMSPSDERLWAMLAHLSGLVISIIGPLIILLTFGKRSAFVKDQSTEALNFQITVFIAMLVSVMLIFVVVGIVLVPIVAIGALILMVIGGIKSYNGETYRYPINIRMVK